MQSFFKEKLKIGPTQDKQGILYFGGQEEGDYFDEKDVKEWRDKWFDIHWNTPRHLSNEVISHIIKQIVHNNHPIVDLACGPGMGFIPMVLNMNRNHMCLATDANALVLEEWNKYIDSRDINRDLNFAQFSVMNIPFMENSVDAYTSFWGISSTREGEKGYTKALKEIYRTLSVDGYFYTVESQWKDIGRILDVFHQMKKQPWDSFLEPSVSWEERFLQQGFEILYHEDVEYRRLKASDNELGRMAEDLDVDIGIETKAYILRKKS